MIRPLKCSPNNDVVVDHAKTLKHGHGASVIGQTSGVLLSVLLTCLCLSYCTVLKACFVPINPDECALDKKQLDTRSDTVACSRTDS